MLEVRANCHRAVWWKNVDRYEEGQKEKIERIIRELNGSDGRAFSKEGEGIREMAKEVLKPHTGDRDVYPEYLFCS
jgi:hypothetical protein